MDTAFSIDVANLSKQYRSSASFVLDNITLQVRPGEVYGFLGANGAGKSTMIRCLLNFIQPSGGQAQILGLDSVHDSVAIKKRVGYLAGDVVLYGNLTGHHFLAYMHELWPHGSDETLHTLIRAFQADLNKPIQELSKGNRQKLGIIQALMHEPDVLILDEPTSGLDPLMQEVFFDQIAAAKARGASVFVSSHNLSEVQRMCDRVGFIREGKLVAEHDVAELLQHASHQFDLIFAGKPPLAELKKIPGATISAGSKPQTASVSIQGELGPLFAVLAKHQVVGFEQKEAGIEGEFMQLYRGSDKEAT